MSPNPKLRISPSGPLALEESIPGIGPGFIFKSSVLVSVVYEGSLDMSSDELRADMSEPETNLRPLISDVNIDNFYIASTSFDVLISGAEEPAGDLTTTLQVSRDNGASWFTLGSVKIFLETLVEQIVHVHLNTERLAISSIPNIVDGDNLIARTLVAYTTEALNTATVISDGDYGNATVSLIECL